MSALHPPPPAQLAVYVDALGVDMAIEFLLRFGGAELYVPVQLGENSKLEEALGRAAAEAVCQVRDRLPARIHTGKRWIAAVWHSQGLSKAEIARRLHVSDVSVRAYLKDAPDPRQPSLFD